MVEVNKYGRTSLYIKDIGKIIKLMEEVDSFIQTVMSMKENGKMTKLMEKAFIIIMMDQATTVSGTKTYNKGSESKSGQINHHIKGIFHFI